MAKDTTKKWETLKQGILPIKQEIKVFPLYCGMFGNIIFLFLKLSRLIFKWETKFSLGILWSNPISSTLFRGQTLEIYSGRIRGKNRNYSKSPPYNF